MNQIKIGKFIAELRKEKNLTQLQLGDKIGVSDKTVSKWETGRGLPELSTLKPLSDELGISINELLSGERIQKEQYQEKLEENIINTIDYSSKRIREKNNVIGILLIVFGILITIAAMSVFPSESSWGSIYSVFGAVISLIGISRFTKRLSIGKRLICNFGYIIIVTAMLFIIDYIGVINIKQAPRFCYKITTTDNMILYEAPFYNVYRINRDTKNEYYIVDTEKKYTFENVPDVPFDRDKSGIDNIIQYKSKYIGDNSNAGNLIGSLPLSEYGYVFQIDSYGLGLTIDYHVTDWYIDDNLYMKRSLIYNSVSIFSLIDNVSYINYNFSGRSYRINRSTVETLYPDYADIRDNDNGINTDNFNQLLENKITDDGFVEDIFEKILS